MTSSGRARVRLERRVRRLAPHAWRYWWTVAVETPLVGRTVLSRAPAFVRLLFRLGGQPSASAAEQFVASLREPARARAAERVMGAFEYREIVPTLLGRHSSTRLTVPTLMLNGTRNFALSAPELGGYEAHADDLRIQLVEDGGHFLAEERPALVAAAALEHFESPILFLEPQKPGRSLIGAGESDLNVESDLCL